MEEVWPLLLSNILKDVDPDQRIYRREHKHCFFNGQYFAADEDVVVVTLNYRLGIFGFPGAPGEAQNLGLRDQRLAVEWLRDNVSAFGGDPDRITIFGHSSGALAVDTWAYAYNDDPIVAGMIRTPVPFLVSP